MPRIIYAIFDTMPVNENVDISTRSDIVEKYLHMLFECWFSFYLYIKYVYDILHDVVYYNIHIFLQKKLTKQPLLRNNEEVYIVVIE